jgi:hypothetical protein
MHRGSGPLEPFELNSGSSDAFRSISEPASSSFAGPRFA